MGELAVGAAFSWNGGFVVLFGILTSIQLPSYSESPRRATGLSQVGNHSVEDLPKGKYYVTVAGGARLQAEYEELLTKRTEVAGNIRTAKAYGDLSENFEYHEAKREQGFLEGRIQQLKVILPSLHVVRPEDVPLDTVSFGSVVTLREETGDEWDVLIVGPLEADPMSDRISYESPLGSALTGETVGKTVSIEVPAGRTDYEIVAIRTYEA